MFPNVESTQRRERIAGEAVMKSQVFTAVLHKEDDLYVASCPEVGTFSQGVSVEEAIANLKEATEVYLAEFPMTSAHKALLTTFEAAVHA